MSRAFTIAPAPAGAFVAPADGVEIVASDAEPVAVTHVGAAVATAEAMDAPLVLPGGEEVEEMGGPNSLWVAQFGHFDEDFLVSAGPSHAQFDRGTVVNGAIRYFPESPLVLARANGGDVSLTFTLTGSNTTRVARWLVGTMEDTARLGTAGFMGQTVGMNTPVTVTVPNGQRIAWTSASGSGTANVMVTLNDSGEPIFGSPNPMIPTRARVFDPAGRHAELPPATFAHVPFRVRRAGAAEDETLTAVVRRALPATQPAMSAVALDGDGDPVAFRFDRLHRIGQALDGRPFVVAPDGVRLLVNDGSRVTVPVNRVARWRGAELLVVGAPGQVPSRVVELTHSRHYALAAGVAAPDFTGWPASPNGVGTLTVRPQFESLHLYLDSADTAATEVRFRRQGSDVWFAAQPLIHDPRDPAAEAYSYTDHAGVTRATTMAEVTPGRHRNLIAHLASGTTYEVQVRQGTKLWAATVQTLRYKPAKATAALGTVNGDVTITRAGDVVTVTRAGLPALTITAPSGVYAEIGPGLVRGGGVVLDAERVILRDVDVIGAPESAIRLTPRARDLRIVRGRLASWGRKDNVPGMPNHRPTNVGWAFRHNSAIDMSHAFASNSGFALIGLRTGAPRHPANHWQHFNPSVGSQRPPATSGQTWTVGTGNHPWGSTFVFWERGSFLGGNALLDCSFAGSSLRPCEDGVMGTNNFSRTAAGIGPNGVVAHCFVAGATDDMLEMDGSNQNLLLLGNWLEMERGVQWVIGPASGVSISVGYWGPSVARRNVFRYGLRRADLKTFSFGTSGMREANAAFKCQRSSADHTGFIVLDHNTALGTRVFVSNANSQTRQLIGRGNFARLSTSAAVTAETGTDVVWSDNDIAQAANSPATVEPESAILTSAVGTAARLANVNDGGPWASATPRAGAA